MRITEAMRQLKGWKAVGAAVVIVSLVAIRVYTRMDRQQGNDVGNVPVGSAANSDEPAEAPKPVADPNRRSKLSVAITPIPLAGKPVSEGEDAWVTPVPVDATKLVRRVAWSRDGERLLTVTQDGHVKMFSLPGISETQENLLEGRCSFIGTTKDGLAAVLSDTGQVVLVDDTSLEVLRRVDLPNVSRIATAPTISTVYALTGDSIVSVDLNSGMAAELTVEIQLLERSQKSANVDFSLLTLTPDGRFLLSGSRAIQRARIDGPRAIVEEFGPAISRNARDLLANDDFVAMPSGGGNDPPDQPPIGQGTYVYSVENLQDPVYGHYTGASPRTYGFDSVASCSYAQSRGTQVIVLNSDGLKRRYNLAGKPAVKDAAHFFLVHPKGNRLCVLTDSQLYWVELPGAEDNPLHE
ncbi:MAG: hypothetical protein HOH82_00280 [Planctomycetaceae bacterium]|nr:hypothetical protein [Planctomycetaceae bacterium]